MQLHPPHTWLPSALPALRSFFLPSKAEFQPDHFASAYQSTDFSISSEAQCQLAMTKQNLARELSHPEPKVLDKLSQVNRKRAARGLSPIDLPRATQSLEAIARDASLSGKQKKEKVEALRQELGLSKGEMKTLFTKRLQAAYKNAERRLASFEKAKSAQLQTELKQAEARYGKASPQAKAVLDKMESLRTQLDPAKQALQTQAKFFGSLYPGFWSKLGSAFKKIGRGLSKVVGVLHKVFRFLPALGPLLSNALKPVQFLLQGKLGSFGKSLLGVLGSAKSLLPMIPGVGPIANFAVTGIEALLKSGRSTRTP